MIKFFERQKPQQNDPPTDGFGCNGIVTVRLYDRDGKLKAVRGPMRNTVVQIGRSYILQQLGSALTQSKSKRSCRWTGIGASSLAATISQTKLVSQLHRKENTFTFTSGNDYSSCICTFTSFGDGTKKATIYESALFWSTNTGDNVMLARQTFAARFGGC